MDKFLTMLRDGRAADAIGLAGVVVGVVFVAVGSVLPESSGPAVRTLGGLLFLGGLAALLFGEPRRRAKIIASARRAVDNYMARTADWIWPNRVGLAGVAIGLILIVPAVILQALFGSVFGAIVIVPGLVLFWGGVALLIYGRFYRGDAAGKGKGVGPSQTWTSRRDSGSRRYRPSRGGPSETRPSRREKRDRGNGDGDRSLR